MTTIDPLVHAPPHLRDEIVEMRKRLMGYKVYQPKKMADQWSVSVEGARCALLLSEVFGGLHNLRSSKQAQYVDWSGSFVRITERCLSLSTCDGDDLTRVVILAHEHAIRVDIGTAGMSLEMLLHPRKYCVGEYDDWSAQHPSLLHLRSKIDRRIEERVGRRSG